MKLIYFLDADQTVFTRTLQLAKLWTNSTISTSTATSSSVEGRTRVPIVNLSNYLLSWWLSLVSDMVMFFHSGSHKSYGSDKSCQLIFQKFLIWATPSSMFYLSKCQIQKKCHPQLVQQRSDSGNIFFFLITINNNTENQPVTDKPSLML